MFRDIKTIIAELSSNKIQARGKAFTKLYDILTNRLRDVQNEIESGGDEISFETIFCAAHEGIAYHSEQMATKNENPQETDAKIANYTKTILKICDSPANESSGIPYSVLMKVVNDVFKSDAVMTYFGKCYFQLLKRYVLKPDSDLTLIKPAQWKETLHILFALMKSKRHKIALSETIPCAKLVVEFGCSFSHLSPEIAQYLEVLKLLLEKHHQEREKLLMLAYSCCRNISAEYRFEVARFTESIAQHIHSVFKPSLTDDVKETLYRLMDLSLIVHYPNLAVGRGNLEYVHNKEIWNAGLRNYWYIVGVEMKQQAKSKYRSSDKEDVNQVLAQFAARLSFLVRWDLSFFDEIENDKEQPSKRARHPDKLQSLMELAQPTDNPADFNWRWLAIIAEVIYNYPSALEKEDFQPLLKMLSECQVSCELEYQLYAYTKCCYVLLELEESVKQANSIIANLCLDFWHKIAEATFRSCTSNNKQMTRSHALLQILVHYRKHPSNSFIEDVIKIFLSKSTAKADSTLQTLVTLLTSFNLDLLQNGKELTKKLLTYTFEKSSLADFKQIIASGDKPSARVLSQIGAICCLSKTDVVNFSRNKKIDLPSLLEENWKLELQKSYLKEVSEMTRLILLKCYDRLLIEDENFNLSSQITVEPKNSEFPVEIKCIIDNFMYDDVIQKVTEFKTKVIDESKNAEEIKDYLILVLENIELLMNLANSFMSFESLNEEKFVSCFAIKKIDFHVQEIERLFTLILEKRAEREKLDMKDTQKLLLLVKAIFKSEFHQKICEKIRSFSLTNCLRWVSKQANHNFRSQDEDNEFMKIGAKEFANAKMDERMKFLAIETLCEYNNFEGNDTEYLSDRLDMITFEYEDNMDLHTIFHVVNLFGRQKSVSKEIVQWVWKNQIIPLCLHYNKNQYVSSLTIALFGQIVQISKNDPEMTSNIISIFVSFGTLCAEQQMYNPSVSVEFLKQFQVFHKEYVKYSADEEAVFKLYEFVFENFLQSKIFVIKMAAIKCISAILASDIEKDEIKEARLLKTKIFAKIIGKYKIKFEEMEIDIVNDDEEFNKISSHIQLFTSIFCVNFILRKPIIYEMSKLVVRYKLPDETSLKIFQKFLTFLKCDAESLFDSNSIVHLLFQWLHIHPIEQLPWYFFGRSSLNDFLTFHYDLLGFAILKKRQRDFDQFCTNIEFTPKQMIQELLPNCFAYILPIQAGCVGIKYEAIAEEMSKKIGTYYTASEQESIMLRKTAIVIGNVLEYVFDPEKFKEISDFELEVHQEMEMLNCDNFDKCLNHLKKYFSMPTNHSLLTFFCHKRGHFIEQLLMTQKKKIQSTSLKEHKMLYFLQYCVLIEKLYDYLNDSSVSSETSIKGYLVKEIVYFICFLLKDESYGMRLRQTASSFFSKFLKKILPVCALDVKPLLNKIISTTLVSICKKIKGQTMNSFELNCFKTIEFLINDQQSLLEDEIASLDKFPNNQEFDEMREKQLKVKYKNGKFSLEEEIELFLKKKNRRVEGLVALREHLAENKSELKAFYNQLSMTLGFSEDGEKSLIHKLLRSLVGYARNSAEEEERAVAAVKCLGEIGNYDVATMVFITEGHQKTTIYRDMETVVNCQKAICATALGQLETMILHQNARIFEAASRACYRMLESTSAKGYEMSIYLRPFDTKTVAPNPIFYECLSDTKKLNLKETLKNEEKSTYKTWIKRLVGSMLLYLGDKSLEPVTSVQKTFAEILNPMMFQLLLMYDDKQLNEDIIEGINFFFAEAAEKINYPKANKDSNFLNKLSIKQMLKLVECVRIYCLDHRKSNMTSQLNLNYIYIAKASKHCEAFFTAVLYCEKWAEKRLNDKTATFASSINDKTLQEVMYEAFTAIGINDASDVFVNPGTMRPLYLQTYNRSWQNIVEVDAAFSEDQFENLVKCLNEMGLHSLSHKLSSTSNDKTNPKQFECLWRMSNWDVVIEGESETKDLKAIVDYREEFEKFHYSSLKCLKNGDELGSKTAIFKARKAVVQLLQQESLECTKNLYKFLGMSHLLQQVEDFGILRFSRASNSHEILLRKWNSQNDFPSDYKMIEPILTHRNSVFDTANIKAGRRDWIPHALQSNMLLIVKESIEAGNENDAIKTMAKMRTLKTLTTTNQAELLIYEAKLNIKSNVKLAKHCLSRVFEEKVFDKQCILKSIAFRLYGELLAESHADEISKIDANYFKRSILYLEAYAKQNNKSHLVAKVDYSQLSQEMSQPELSENDEADVDKTIKANICVFNIVAKYFDREYVSRCEYIDSPDFRKKLTAIEKNKLKMKGFQELCAKDKQNKELYKSFAILKRSLEIDELEVKETYKQKKIAAGNSMFYYLRGAINDSSGNIISVFRIISIWLANLTNEVIFKMLKESLLKIPSCNFIVALPQLSVRITGDQNDRSNVLLMNLLERCAIEHPHHTLPLILALVNSYADSDSKFNQEEPRVIGAKKLWQSCSTNKKISPMLKQMEDMSAALIKLAYNECQTIPSNLKIAQLKNLHLVQCPTIDIPLSKDGNYFNQLTSVVKWSQSFDLCGGINAPKKIYCYCSDGIKRPQLLKGFDDMRQDAVMQQVFGVVNSLLNDNKETRKRHARVRTYKVVPLARRSGILEWCENTTTVGNYLTRSKDKKGAHEKYYPEDWTPLDCMKKILEGDKGSPEMREKNFLEVCAHIRPAFHHFFYENYKEPGQWFERRLAYTTSVAVSSMVGYILGIGDRHVQNILIDCNTAEVIHIDFGIAFEQGKILPHPELVPFRLSRDIIAPMGVCGVDGVFRKTCEKTMEILRENHTTLTTILEVLLYDPMYAWTLSASQAQRYQLEDDDNQRVNNRNQINDDSIEEKRESVDSMASRALLRIQAKLKGQADDSSGYSSVEGQVECLINKAINTSFLSRLFKGWQAYL